MIILMDSLDELYGIVDKTTKEDELVNDFTIKYGLTLLEQGISCICFRL